MKYLLLFTVISFSSVAQKTLREFEEKQPIGFKISGKPFMIEAKEEVDLFYPDKLETDNTDIKIPKGTVIHVIGAWNTLDAYWVVRYKDELRITYVTDSKFSYDEDIFDKAFSNEILMENKVKREEEFKKLLEEIDNKRHRELLNKYGGRFTKAIESGDVEIGMTKGAVIESWGEPSNVVTTKTSKGTKSIWTYSEKVGIITLFNGKVVKVETIE